MSPEQAALLARARNLLAHREMREVRMFGAVALMIDGAMLVAVNADGSLLVRVSPAHDAVLLDQPGASRAEMGAGRSMGVGWIRVAGDVVGEDLALEEWVAVASRRHERSARATVQGARSTGQVQGS